jgi:hypothetical protein
VIGFDDLNHDETTDELRELNARLVSCFSLSDPSELATTFNRLTLERQHLVTSILTALQDNHRRAFATNELIINDKLNTLAQSLLDSAKQEIVQYMRGRAAVKKYR